MVVKKQSISLRLKKLLTKKRWLATATAKLMTNISKIYSKRLVRVNLMRGWAKLLECTVHVIRLSVFREL